VQNANPKTVNHNFGYLVFGFFGLWSFKFSAFGAHSSPMLLKKQRQMP